MKNEMNLTDAEMQTLVRWVNAGAPVDGDVDPLVGLQWPETKWVVSEELGETEKMLLFTQAILRIINLIEPDRKSVV